MSTEGAFTYKDDSLRISATVSGDALEDVMNSVGHEVLEPHVVLDYASYAEARVGSC